MAELTAHRPANPRSTTARIRHTHPIFSIAAKPKAMSDSRAARILVVDDSKVSRNMAVGLIRVRRPDAELFEAGDGMQAIALAAEQQPDLVIMDVNMPGITGIEAATAILAQRPQTTIVLLTANVQAATQAKADAAGVLLFKKPIKGDVIDAILQHLTVPA